MSPSTPIPAAGATPHPSASPPPSPAGGEGNTELAALIDRLQAKLGEGAILRPEPRESWLPERSEAWAPASPNTAPAGFDLGRDRPILLLERPEQVAISVAKVPDGAPRQFTWRRVPHQVVKAEGPERISAEWWRQPTDAARRPRTRDYYRLEDNQGRRYWLFREGLYGREDTETVKEKKDGKDVDKEIRWEPTWWMHGVFA